MPEAKRSRARDMTGPPLAVLRLQLHFTLQNNAATISVAFAYDVPADQNHAIFQLLQDPGQSRGDGGVEERYFDSRDFEERGSISQHQA